MAQDYFIAIYTNKVKDYCDEKFFQRVKELSNGNEVHVVDNTSKEKGDYFEKLKKICNYENFNLYHVDVPYHPKNTLFHRNISTSVSLLRDKFLQSGKKKFFIIESDVIPPVDVLSSFDKRIEVLPDNWGILGGLYYSGLGFHDRKINGMHKKKHVLSGCSVYKRELIEKYPFRWAPDLLGAFPDALICFDSKNEFTFFDDHDIVCEHMHSSNGSRYSSQL